MIVHECRFFYQKVPGSVRVGKHTYVCAESSKRAPLTGISSLPYLMGRALTKNITAGGRGSRLSLSAGREKGAKLSEPAYHEKLGSDAAHNDVVATGAIAFAGVG